MSLAVFVLACGGSDPTATPPSPSTTATRPPVAPTSTPVLDRLTPDEEQYLESVRDAEVLGDQVFSRFRQIFGRTYTTREPLLIALLEAGVGTPFKLKSEALEVIDPPARFQADHAVWVEANKELARLDAEAAQAVRDGNMVEFVLINGQLSGISARNRLMLSAVFCGSTATNPLAATSCRPDQTVLQGGYPVQLNQLLRQFLPQFLSMTGTLSFPLVLTADELAQVISVVSSATRDQFQSTISELSSLAPPAEMTADQARLESFLTQALATLEQAESLAESGDPGAAQQEFLALTAPFCGARRGFESPGFKDAVAVVFQGPPGTCRGEPF